VSPLDILTGRISPVNSAAVPMNSAPYSTAPAGVAGQISPDKTASGGRGGQVRSRGKRQRGAVGYGGERGVAGLQEGIPVRLIVSSDKLCKFRKYKVELLVSHSWRLGKGIPEAAMVEGLSCAVCCKANTLETVSCGLCACDSVVSLSSVLTKPDINTVTDTEIYTCLITSRCTSSRNHLKSPLTLVITSVPGIGPVQSNPFSLLARDKNNAQRRQNISLDMRELKEIQHMHTQQQKELKARNSQRSDALGPPLKIVKDDPLLSFQHSGLAERALSTEAVATLTELQRASSRSPSVSPSSKVPANVILSSLSAGLPPVDPSLK